MEEIYDPYEVGWVAGLLDGEGSILIIPTNYRRKINGTNTKSARVMVDVCDFKILERYTTILSKWGIEYGHSLQVERHKGWHDKILIQVWKIPSIIKLLRIVTPHLTLKQGAAQLVLQFAEWRMNNRTRVGGGRVYNPEIFEQEEVLWQEYLAHYKGRARSHDRPLRETVRENSTPLRWLD